VLRREASASAANLITTVKSEERRYPTFIGFYVGNGDSRFKDDNVRFDAQLKAAHVPHTFAIYAGGHQTSLWQRHAVQWLTMALHRLSPPR
jgi:enterochelin esterase-like enzyme